MRYYCPDPRPPGDRGYNMSILDEDKSLFGESTSEIDGIMDEYPGTLLVIACDIHCRTCTGRKYSLRDMICPVCGETTIVKNGGIGLLYNCTCCQSSMLSCGLGDVRTVKYQPQFICKPDEDTI